MLEMAQVEQGVASIASQLGGIDILINNAGVGDFGSFEDMPVETWEKVMKVNLFWCLLRSKSNFALFETK